jgi:urease accessory protein UreF
MNAAALLHLLQFASPALPIGGYSYSQGLEAALEAGMVSDAAGAAIWIARCLHEVVAQWDAPLLWRLLQAFEAATMPRSRCGASASWPRATPPSSAPRRSRWAIRSPA